MRAFLIGNGYDLKLNLPTKYVDFLSVGDFLLKNKMGKFDTVASIFSSRFFADKESIQKAFRCHREAYEAVKLEKEDIKKIVELLEGNVWFNYFLSSFNKELGWIDFEKEIRKVVEAFQFLFSKQDIRMSCSNEGISPDKRYIYSRFEILNEDPDIVFDLINIDDTFVIEYPINSGNKIQDVDKIADYLIKSLRELSDALSLYMKCFVDSVLCKLDISKFNSEAYYADVAISLNYTHTYEVLNRARIKPHTHYPAVIHVHGEVGQNIVLGINSDSSDIADYSYPVFAPFKKYFQRVQYMTDTEYIGFIKSVKKSTEKMQLTIVGHSLDITDRDLIEALFDVAETITVLYHSEKSLSSLIRNLISIFGVDRFNALRFDKDLVFIDMNDKDAMLGNAIDQSWDDGFNQD